jgi:hypothetical protein
MEFGEQDEARDPGSRMTLSQGRGGSIESRPRTQHFRTPKDGNRAHRGVNQQTSIAGRQRRSLDRYACQVTPLLFGPPENRLPHVCVSSPFVEDNGTEKLIPIEDLWE